MDGLNPFGGSGADIRSLLRALLMARMSQAQSGQNPIYEDTETVGGLGGGLPGIWSNASGNQSIGADQYGQWGAFPTPTNAGMYEDTETVGGLGGGLPGIWSNASGSQSIGEDRYGTWGAPPNLGSPPRIDEVRSLGPRGGPPNPGSPPRIDEMRSLGARGGLGPLGIAARLIAATIANSGGRGFDTNVGPNSYRVGGSLMGRANTPGMLTNADRLNSARSRNLF